MFAVIVVARIRRDVTQLSRVAAQTVTYETVGVTGDADVVAKARAASAGSASSHYSDKVSIDDH